jgi:hypothetical protein
MKTFAIMCFIAAAMAAPAVQNPTARCCEAQAQLEKGIQANLDIQGQELKGYVFPTTFPKNILR